MLECVNIIKQLTNTSQLTLNNNNTVGAVRAQLVGGHTLVLATVTGLTVDDFNGDDSVSVGDGIQRGIKRLARLKELMNI